MKNFRSLKVWHKAHELTLHVYRGTEAFPRAEVLGLTNQLRRAASSIGANIAEGCGRGSDADFRKHLQIAMGSATELDNHLLLARDLGFLSEENYAQLFAEVDEVEKMLAAFISRLRAPSTRSRQAAHNGNSRDEVT